MPRFSTVSRLFVACLATWSPLHSRAVEATDPISLAPIANRGLRDDVAGDGRGGWTDQGPDNDLATLRPGRLEAAGVSFEVLDPAANNGLAVLVLGQASQKVAHDAGEAARPDAGTPLASGATMPRSVTLKLPGAGPYRFLYLLHAAANSPTSSQVLGSLIIHYADGTLTRHDLQYRRDVGNWRDPFPAENAGIAWESENPTASIGLYVSRFAVEEKPLASVAFEHSGPGAWMVVSLTGSMRDVEVGLVPKPLVIEPGEDWAPYRHSLDIAPGGVFDFSSLLDAPAGKHGALRAAPAGHFEFVDRPGKRVRFWGVNLCFTAQFLDHAEADLLADRLARSGYNSVRFHHFDAELTRGGRRSWDLDPGALDRIDYLFAALKRRGIYVNIDLFSSRSFSDAEIAEWEVPGTLRGQFKALLPINDSVFTSWARFATALLTHRNPHTGLTWAEDPALIGICPVNENPLFNRIENNPQVLSRYTDAFARSGGEGPAVSSNPRFNEFIHELNRRSDERMASHLRSLGVRALITGANYTISQGLTYVREHYDYVDCHSYWDHPKFPARNWALPIAFGQGSSVRARAKMPARIMPTRIFGRPFVSTEFNFCRPNRFRFEGAVLMPAYASLQDWDALYNFQYAMSRTMAVEGGVENYFAIACDPIGLIADRLGALLFQRGDIAPARGAIAYAVQREEAFSALGRLFPGEFSPLGLVTRVGSLTGRPEEIAARVAPAHRIDAYVAGGPPGRSAVRTYRPDETLAAALERDGILPAGSVSANRTVYRSDTGEIELDAEAGTVRVVTARSELFVLAPGNRMAGARVSVANGATPGSVAVVALESTAPETLSLATARRILIAHLTDALPQGMRFSHTDRKLLQDWGAGPHLLRSGELALELDLPEGAWRAWAVDATGARTHEVPLTVQGSKRALSVSTISPRGTQLAYELAR